MKTQNEKVELQNAKLEWRRKMRVFFGKSWTKRKASRMSTTGRQMNIPS